MENESIESEVKNRSTSFIVKTAEASSILGVSIASVRSLVKEGKLKGYKKPGNKGWSGIIRASVEEYIKNVESNAS